MRPHGRRAVIWGHQPANDHPCAAASIVFGASPQGEHRAKRCLIWMQSGMVHPSEASRLWCSLLEKYDLVQHLSLVKRASAIISAAAAIFGSLFFKRNIEQRV
jgi:hypothetical protein